MQRRMAGLSLGFLTVCGCFSGETGAVVGKCDTPDDPDRGMGFRPLLARLGAQRCLSEADQDALIAWVDPFYEQQDVWCDAIYRLSSPDGRTFTGEPEPVREHASVSDVVITAEGAHVVVFNDLAPGLFAATLRTDPERFWRQGLVGIGGLGLLVDSGEGFAEVPLDLHLPELALVVDPDLTVRPAGDYRLVTFVVPGTALDGHQWDPFQSKEPHGFFRAVSPRFDTFPGPRRVVASRAGKHGGADPTVLDLPDGEILFVGDFTEPLRGWSAPAGRYPPLGAVPGVSADLPVAGPKAVVDPTGPYRLYFVDFTSGLLSLATSTDGRSWSGLGPVVNMPQVNSPGVARAADGTWWLYFNRREPGCVSKVRGAARGDRLTPGR
ncbi:MAG: hypothetical protein V4850_15680 [Myxococcota bacterium]